MDSCFLDYAVLPHPRSTKFLYLCQIYFIPSKIGMVKLSHIQFKTHLKQNKKANWTLYECPMTNSGPQLWVNGALEMSPNIFIPTIVYC